MTTLRAINLMAGHYASICLHYCNSNCNKDNICDDNLRSDYKNERSNNKKSVSNDDDNNYKSYGLNAQDNTNC